MDAQSILLLIVYIISIGISFFAGYSFCHARGLAGNTELCENLARSVSESEQRIEESTGELEGLYEASQRVAAVLDKYRDQAEDSSNVE